MRDAKKISTSEHPVWLYGCRRQGIIQPNTPIITQKFIGSKLIIGTVDALVGAGKTFAAGKHAARAAGLAGLGEKTLSIQPTKELITETINGIRQHSPDIRMTAIHFDTTENVVADIVQHTKEASRHQGEILFITHRQPVAAMIRR